MYYVCLSHYVEVGTFGLVVNRAALHVPGHVAGTLVASVVCPAVERGGGSSILAASLTA